LEFHHLRKTQLKNALNSVTTRAVVSNCYNFHLRYVKMTIRHTHNKILITGLLIGILSIGLLVGTAAAGPNPQPAAQGTETPSAQASLQDCTDCHPNVEDVWVASPHAHAFDDEEFSSRWEAMGKPGECLACHTTGYQSSTNAYTGEGVQCEACHGEAVEGHPPAVVPVKADTDYCGTCHTTTLSEWRLTGHGTAGVGCMDCHDPHSQQALFENPDDMCLNCHKDDMGPYLEDIHIQKGIGCVDCHALVIPPEEIPSDGIVPTGHAFTITPATCVACHTDSLHAGFSLPGYEDGAKAANGGGTGNGETGQIDTALETVPEFVSGESVLTTEQRVQALEAALASTRLSTLFQGGIIGIVLGGITVYYLGRNRPQNGETEGDDRGDNPAVSDDDVVDQQLENVVVAVERFMDWTKTKFTRAAKKAGQDKPADDPDNSSEPKS
jgi:predicted CXXCH cytochrome family protein